MEQDGIPLCYILPSSEETPSNQISIQLIITKQKVLLSRANTLTKTDAECKTKKVEQSEAAPAEKLWHLWEGMKSQRCQ